jgi:Ca-activated chloride channel family protein
MPESLLSRSGLFTTTDVPVPLAGVSIEAHVASACTRVTVAQRYVNREAVPIEAVYVFPLDDGAAVCGFEAVIDGTLVVGEVQEREKAFETYDNAMERGHGAFLLDEERPDIFQASVGNLPPGKEVLLKVTYVSELAVDDGALRLVIPTTISPRYAPAKDYTGVGRPDAVALNPPLGWAVPYGLNLSVRVAGAAQASRIESPSHPVAIATADGDVTVTLSQENAALDRDFVLSIASAAFAAPRAWVELGGDGESAVAVAFVPRFERTAEPAEIVFLVDRSNSMEGDSIAEVRNALQLCLRSMIHGCAFNIVSFGNTYTPLFGSSRPYDEASLAEATAHVREMSADLGGTELEPALRFVLEQPRHGAMARQVVVLTDGEITNTNDVLALARLHAADTRIFTFGIGAGASHHLLKGIARIARGTCEQIFPGERIEPKVLRLFSRLLSPALTDVRVDWGGLDVIQAPQTVPAVFAGGRLVLYAFARDIRRAAVALTAATPSGPVAFEVTVDPSDARAGSTLATLAARARIRELEESAEWLRGSRQRERRESTARVQIVQLATKYGLVSRETSYVAVERRESPVLDRVELRRVPIALTYGWGGADARAVRRPIERGAGGPTVSQLLPNAIFSPPAASLPPSPRPALSSRGGFVARARSHFRRPVDIERSAPPPPPTGFHALVALQCANGAWDLTEPLADAIGHDLDQLRLAVRSAIGPRREIETAWATALALAWLQEHAAAFEDEWKLLAGKARQWLARSPARTADGAPWVDVAARLLTVKR